MGKITVIGNRVRDVSVDLDLRRLEREGQPAIGKVARFIDNDAIIAVGGRIKVRTAGDRGHEFDIWLSDAPSANFDGAPAYKLVAGEKYSRRLPNDDEQRPDLPAITVPVKSLAWGAAV